MFTGLKPVAVYTDSTWYLGLQVWPLMIDLFVYIFRNVKIGRGMHAMHIRSKKKERRHVDTKLQTRERAMVTHL